MSSSEGSPPIASKKEGLRALRDAIDRGMLRDRGPLRGRLRRIEESARGGRDVAAEYGKALEDATRSAERATLRRQKLPAVTYPEELPICARREDIRAAIEANQVVIICGETGSGKTTQLPKICLDMGRGVQGMIGHTQPRRIAARSVAARVASELRTSLGDAVGYQVRFTDKSSPDSYIKLMTDGILLAETQGDRWLSQYDTLIIDEAHERSLNIDFLLGYIRQLLPKRPEMKLIITSATIDAQKFSTHFGNAPVIEVSGRLYPVDVLYRPFDEDDEDEHEIDLPEAIVNAVDELTSRSSTGDVLVFLPGEREIREAAEALRKHRPAGAEILPLFARLSAQEQERIFAPGGGRRIVLATNVAETSLTVPGIRYVVDSGLARVNRYSYRNKVELLQVEKISRASANQRAGRCGRVMNGICLRLYSEEDFAARTEFTDPEILRSSLASVILRMSSLNLGEIEDFPFVDAPTPRMIADGFQLLSELGAVDESRRITPIGRQLAKLPIDPRVARMLVAAKEEGCLNEVLVIAAALSVQDPRERPMDKQEAVAQAHAEFLDEKSDFLSYLAIWKWFEEALVHKKSNRKLVQECHDRFLSYLRLREWRELHGQLHALVAEMGWRLNEKPARYEEVHRALLAGLLGNIGFKSEEAGIYIGARQIKFVLSPASALKKKGPKWVMAAELTETTRLFARVVASIEPEWIERLAPHLAKRSYREPHWSKDSGSVIASEQVTVYGLVVVPKRLVQYGPIAPKEAWALFIRGALVAGQYSGNPPFLEHNRRLISEVQELEHKSRRHDVLVDDETIFAFYAERVPEGIHSAVDFDKWRRQAEQADPKLLFLTREYLMRHTAEQVTEAQFPDAMAVGMQTYDLNYRFEPGHVLDGVTMVVPLHLLNQVDENRCEWLVPGLRRDKITHLIKSLPKGVRKHFVPVPQVVTACMEILEPDAAPLTAALSQALFRKTGVDVPLDAWDASDLPAHLRMNFRVVDEKGNEIAGGRDLAALRSQLGVKARKTFSEAASASFERKGITSWDFDDLPEQVEVKRDGRKLIGYPAIVDEGKSVALTLLDTDAEAEAATRRGLRRLFQLALPEQMKFLARSLPGFNEMQLRYMLMGQALLRDEGGKPEKGGRQDKGARFDKSELAERLREELTTAICDRSFFVEAEPVRDRKSFETRVAKGKTRLMDVAQEVCRIANEIFAEHQALSAKLGQAQYAAHSRALTDIRAQLRELMPAGFLASIAFERLKHYPRYLKAISVRLDKLASNPERDANWQSQLTRYGQAYQVKLRADRDRGIRDPKLEELRWMLEELRVSLWAQQLKTPYPVSFKRLEKFLGEIKS
jgi:ATP-dependent helicase HrpA